MKLLKVLNPKDISRQTGATFQKRYASRAIVIDSDHRIAMLHVSKHKFCKLPGGGIEDGETPEKALERECLEEIGCRIEIVGEIGMIEEYRDIHSLHQFSYCWLARVMGNKGIPAFEQDEIAEGFEIHWLRFPQIMFCMSMSKSEDREAMEYIIPRDQLFLMEFKKKYPEFVTTQDKNHLCGE